MPTARRSALPAVGGSHSGSHAGLLLARYLAEASKDAGGTADSGSTTREQARKDLLVAAQKATADPGLKSLYELAYARWQAMVTELKASSHARTQRFRSAGRLILGLGGENVTETGLTLHHTYGVPYLPGTALKGLAAHYAHTVWGGAEGPDAAQWTLDGECHRTLFGTLDDGGMGGLVDFQDGWITPSSLGNCLALDVMTPHHTGYYMSDESEVTEPSDFDSPIPVSFLSVKGAFDVAVSARDPRLPAEWVARAMDALTAAIRDWGIGGKTSSGDGRMTAD